MSKQPPPDNIYDKKQTGRKLIQSLIFICFFALFYTVFNAIEPYYIKDASKTHGPVDSRVADCKFFDAAYVYDAKHGGYAISKYFQLYLPLDIVFPVFYTMMFLAMLSVFKTDKLYKPLRYLVFAGMVLDYLENFTFSFYLLLSAEFASVVAFFTTIKTFFFLFNIAVFVLGFVYLLVAFFKTKRSTP